MTPADATPTPAQLRLVVRLNRGINLLAGRGDLITTVRWKPEPDDPPAWFTPATGEVTLNGPVALDGAKPSEINPLTPEGRLRHPVIIGLLCHEAGHAAHTQWDSHFGDGIDVIPTRAAVLLEEIRIEHRQLRRRPGDRLYLRAASRRVILPGADAPSAAATRWRAGQAALLTSGRVDAGVLTTGEVRKVAAVCRTTLGRKDFDRLRRVWRKALTVPDGDVDGLMKLATRWADIIGVEDPADAPAPPCGHGVLPDSTEEPTASDQESGRDEQDAASTPDADEDTGADELEKALAEAFQGAMVLVAASGEQEAAAELGHDEDSVPDDGERRRAQDAAEQEAAETEAERVFHGNRRSGASDPRGELRPPTAIERELARRTGKALRRAKFRERGKIVVDSAVPPGRLRGREAMLGAAQRSMGTPITAKPFRRVIRKDTPEPPLTVGIAVDISGSMDWATEMLASLAWIVAHAAAEVDGMTATVAFGERVTAITAPGVPPAAVQEFDAPDGYHEFVPAMRALDGALQLTAGQGARLVFVVSDGHYGPAIERQAAEVVERFARHGVHVVWLDLASEHDTTIVPPGAIPIRVANIGEIPHQVEDVLVRALRVA
ncbi:VWA domain-containing protein [Amycolatopsis sp. RTGN1]|uniref:VWA domain-containing protein n=1 Tax=Amycolatopsis ponsaeliensis TaxID=2992142 RepID=UPI0025513013|nr:VWA domain-containing protein [Amycolatopsis sp. RTGN1]